VASGSSVPSRRNCLFRLLAVEHGVLPRRGGVWLVFEPVEEPNSSQRAGWQPLQLGRLALMEALVCCRNRREALTAFGRPASEPEGRL
jgi:hypothetical protein